MNYKTCGISKNAAITDDNGLIETTSTTLSYKIPPLVDSMNSAEGPICLCSRPMNMREILIITTMFI